MPEYARVEITFELMIEIGAKSEVVDKNYIGRVDLFIMFRVQKVALDEFIFPIAFSPPSHKSFEMEIHILKHRAAIKEINTLSQLEWLWMSTDTFA